MIDILDPGYVCSACKHVSKTFEANTRHFDSKHPEVIFEESNEEEDIQEITNSHQIAMNYFWDHSDR